MKRMVRINLIYSLLIIVIKGPLINLPKSLISEFKLMRLKFGETFFNVGSIVMNNPQSPSINDIKRVLGRYSSALKPQLAQCKDVHNILQLVRENSSLDDISVLEVLVNKFNIKEVKPVIKEYKEAIEELKIKLRQFLEKELLKASSVRVLESVTIVIDKDTSFSVLKDVQRLSLAALPYCMRLNVIRSGGNMRWEEWEPESLTDTYVGPTVQSKDTCTLTTEVLGGTTEKDEDQVILLQEKVESIQKQLEEEKELHEKEKQFYEQVIKKYEEEMLQQKRNLIQNEEKIVMLIQQHNDHLKHKTEQYEELRSDYKLTQEELVELQKLLQEKIQTSSILMKQKLAALREKKELQRKIDDLKKKLKLQQVKDHKEVSIQCEYTITESDLPTTHKQLEELEKKLKEEIQTSSSLMKQKQVTLREKEELQIKIDDLQQELAVRDHKEVLEQAPVEQKEETEILQETETVHTCTYISKGDILKLSVILEPFEDDWYHIGLCLEVKESVLFEIKEMTPVDSRLTHVLETWCHEKDRTITELKDSLKRMDRDDILEGLHELPTGQYTMNNDEEYDINDSNDEVETEIETENKEIQTTPTTVDKEIQFNYLVPSQG
ncbi:PREDICTED: CAP-Gly domain-containing linker protein 1-like isoform X2 [Amphimedon queenslandica]|uniref:Death domain-containing protein n=1 Tax=Amphimedon queenslandica TaxID=400682 RepID=A0AAN0JSW2_AMPQE|nr:PREDICTED: CAP-Gly domain-containing linker protein 1-like isoform X2 [Amphimedon queenslandica]|eukprot:XP_019859977.1 PREDICTED: CAP-Gly domain-containing linker protein 1-like isoform X2 [Amphimedon queenslandica]